MWQTCHRNGQFDKCGRVAVHCLQRLPPHSLSALWSREPVMEGKRNGGMREEEMRHDKQRMEGGRGRESDFQRDNEPLNDG